MALHCAYQAVRSGQCPAALVGGINVLLKPATSLQFLKLGMLSPSGTCRSFDEAGEAAWAAQGGPGGSLASWPRELGSSESLNLTYPLTSGDGYCRAEAVVAVLLTKKSLARRVYATILNTGANTDGFKEQGGSRLVAVGLPQCCSGQGTEAQPLPQA